VRIILIGFMGSGKSSIAKLLGKQLGWKVLDTDELIEEKYNCKISELFESKGESSFREIEYDILNGIKLIDQCIISTGGGIIEFEKNIELIKSNAKVVYLKTNPEKVFEFTKNDDHRPLLDVENPMETIRTKIKMREPLYESLADIQIDACDQSLEVSTAIIIDELKPI